MKVSIIMVVLLAATSVATASSQLTAVAEPINASDMFVSSAAPNSSFSSIPGGSGTNAVLDILGGTTQGLLQFNNLFGDLPGQIPLGSKINSAHLYAWYVNDNNNSTIDLYRMTTAWNDSTTTWNTLGGGILDGVNAELSESFKWGKKTPASKQANVKTILQAWSDGAANYGFGFVNTGVTDNFQIASVDNTSGSGAFTPTLIVNYKAASGGAGGQGSGTVPEPLTLASLALVALAAGIYLRRRATA